MSDYSDKNKPISCPSNRFFCQNCQVYCKNKFYDSHKCAQCNFCCCPILYRAKQMMCTNCQNVCGTNPYDPSCPHCCHCCGETNSYCTSTCTSHTSLCSNATVQTIATNALLFWTPNFLTLINFIPIFENACQSQTNAISAMENTIISLYNNALSSSNNPLSEFKEIVSTSSALTQCCFLNLGQISLQPVTTVAEITQIYNKLVALSK